jgi:filamentous hemagglutinin
VRGDSQGGQDSTAGLSRDTSSANGAVKNTFDAQKVATDMAIQQATVQVGMQVAGDVAGALSKSADSAQRKARDDYAKAAAAGDVAGMAQAQADYTAASQQAALWDNDGIGRTMIHAGVAAAGAALGGGNVAGAIGGTVAGDIAGNAVDHATDAAAGAGLASNVASGIAGAVAGGAIGGTGGAVSGANGALGADLYNRQLHPEENKIIKDLANGDANKEHRLEAAGCALVHCAAEFAPGTADYNKYSALENEGASYTAEQAQLKNYNGTSFSAAGYGGMVRQTSGGLFQYPVTDSTADNKAMQAAMAAQRPGSIDYVTFQTGAGIGLSISINLHDGSAYAAGSISASRTKGAGIVIGMIPDNVGKDVADKADLTNQFLNGSSVGGNGCLYGICGGINHARGGQSAIEVGIGIGGTTKIPNPDGNAGGGYSIPVFTIPGMGARNAKH